MLLFLLAGLALSPLLAWSAASTAHKAVSWRKLWPAAAAASVVAGAAVAAGSMPIAARAALAVVAAVVIAAALVDGWEHRLPNVFTAPLVLAGAPILVVISLTTGWGSPLRALLGLLIFGGWMLLLALTGAGAGDAKLAAGVGMWLGWTSWWAFAAGVLVALIGMAGTDLINRTARGRRQSPLGPAIGVGLLAGIAASVFVF